MGICPYFFHNLLAICFLRPDCFKTKLFFPFPAFGSHWTNTGQWSDPKTILWVTIVLSHSICQLPLTNPLSSWASTNYLFLVPFQVKLGPLNSKYITFSLHINYSRYLGRLYLTSTPPDFLWSHKNSLKSPPHIHGMLFGPNFWIIPLQKFTFSTW